MMVAFSKRGATKIVQKSPIFTEFLREIWGFSTKAGLKDPNRVLAWELE